MPIMKFPMINRKSQKTHPIDKSSQSETAIIYCEDNFGKIDGKTANGLTRYSEKYKILSIIDSTKAGLDSGMVLDNIPNGIPVYNDLSEALENADKTPDNFIYGMAPLSGMLSKLERSIILKAIKLGMNIVNGLHEFLNDDREFALASAANNVKILDVRRPRDKKDLKVFSGRIKEVTCPCIAVLGTDGAIGKRTTATILTKTLNDHGIKAVMVGTGQTGLIQGARHGIAIDAIPPQFCSGEMEAAVVEAFEEENPDIIIIEGQGALSHPAYLTSAYILRGSCPDAVILQHAPKRANLSDYPEIPMPSVKSEINLIETFSNTKVIGLTINHENMTEEEIDQSITQFENDLKMGVTDVLTRPHDRLIDIVFSAFPELKKEFPVAV
jgi:uncharacterized NAD-dependent epimerase/dehydratase family protein